VTNATMKLRVTERTRTYGFGTWQSDARGHTRIDYPLGKFQSVTVDLTAPGYGVVNFSIDSANGLFGPDLPVRLIPDGN